MNLTSTRRVASMATIELLAEIRSSRSSSRAVYAMVEGQRNTAVGDPGRHEEYITCYPVLEATIN
jgi:hypothetical protein